MSSFKVKALIREPVGRPSSPSRPPQIYTGRAGAGLSPEDELDSIVGAFGGINIGGVGIQRYTPVSPQQSYPPIPTPVHLLTDRETPTPYSPSYSPSSPPFLSGTEPLPPSPRIIGETHPIPESRRSKKRPRLSSEKKYKNFPLHFELTNARCNLKLTIGSTSFEIKDVEKKTKNSSIPELQKFDEYKLDNNWVVKYGANISFCRNESDFIITLYQNRSNQNDSSLDVQIVVPYIEDFVKDLFITLQKLKYTLSNRKPDMELD